MGSPQAYNYLPRMQSCNGLEARDGLIDMAESFCHSGSNFVLADPTELLPRWLADKIRQMRSSYSCSSRPCLASVQLPDAALCFSPDPFAMFVILPHPRQP